ncbi:uncharacterized protein LOC130629805 isoform X1 [Hydractinia symbiolongicarpus]|uniref:uncharacterized protein LOC130629805 isoform X1 n=1 Tax=Hydractinia symbiolongicarpus TaxID=13093 RepID=UPI00254F07A8|nr:uncharacterized protein LOC130629805 isoform X1 [Hydractinia symbiolongicarpus]XP_057299147.1 uncharacterized protein LOC130629805 isoform X1 [Hydractinia symbiolongicarpus]XP_057299148.1 uncharacterized protein LOC130629805 isoform X1 [Hydractinia symbiolongicarpus]
MHVVFEKAGNLLILRNFTVILFSKYLLHFFLIEELVCAITFKRYRESAKKDLPCKYSETEDLKMLPMMAFLNVARYVTHHYNMYMYAMTPFFLVDQICFLETRFISMEK